jgi:hypothetical protein
MPNVVHIQTNFTAGEISPRLFGRVDLAKYNNGAKTIENGLVQTHGGISRRPGTRFASEVKDSALPPILIEFHFNATESYVLEIGATHATNDNTGYMRPYRQDTNGIPYRILTSGDAVVELTGKGWGYADLPYLKFTQSADTMYIFNGGSGVAGSKGKPMLKLRRIGSEDISTGWEIKPLQSTTSNSFIDGPYLDINTPVTVIDDAGDIQVTNEVHLKCSNDLQDIGQSQTIKAYADELVTTPIYPFTEEDKGRLIRLEASSNSYELVYFKPGTISGSQDYSIIKAKGTGLLDSINEGGASSAKVEFFDVTRGPVFLDGTLHQGRNVSADDTNTLMHLYHATTAQNEAYQWASTFTAGEIEGKVRLQASTQVGWGIITAVSDPKGDTGYFQTVAVEVKKKFIDFTPTKNWRLGAWSDSTGHPSCGTFHQGRLYIGNTKTAPQTLWASEVNVFDTFSPTDPITGFVLDSQSMTITLASSRVNAINYLRSDSQGLLIFTEGGEWLGRATNPSAPITPIDASFTKQSIYGSLATVEAQRLGSSYLVFQRDGATLREYTYEFASDRFSAPNQTLLAEHIAKNKVKDSSIQLGSSQRYWCVTETGELLTLCYDKEQQVVAWSKQKMAESGTGASANTVGLVESVARTTDTNNDNIWILVKRKVGTADKYFVEMIVDEFEVVDDHKNAFFVDCGLSGYSSGGATIWTGLDHLAGEAVYALADSVQYGPFTVGNVTGGVGITLAASANDVNIGLKYKTVVETVPLNVSQGLEPRAKLKRIYSAFVNMYRSISGKLGTTDQLYNIEYSAALSSPPELKTQMAEMSFPDNSEREMIIRFEQDDVHPSNLLSITSEIHLGI